MNLVLASTSPRRSQLLQKYGISFTVASPEIEELTGEHLPPRELALSNARAKAYDVGSQYPDSIVLGADTIVVFHEKVFGKPADLTEAFDMLSQLSGHIHEVMTGVCLLHYASRRRCEFLEVTRVKFRMLTTTDIEQYIKTTNPLDKAGAYAAQEDHGRIIEFIEGSLSNVIGLPIERTLEALNAFEK